MQARYTAHRTTRNSQQKAKMLDAGFSGPNIDPILLRLEDPTIEPGFVDPRHCLVFWGRPSQKIKALINRVQQELLAVAPSESLIDEGNEKTLQNAIVAHLMECPSFYTLWAVLRYE